MNKKMITICPDCKMVQFSCICNFDYNLALKLSKIAHNKCENVPHDIGIYLAREVDKFEDCKEPYSFAKTVAALLGIEKKDTDLREYFKYKNRQIL